jgi:DNA-binding NtrC family response regulator
MGRIMVRILVVEDDALIRAVAIDVLEDAGFAALEAENAMEAISVLDEHAEDIAVLLTDVRMPGPIDGITLAKIAEKTWPWICAVVTSGSPVQAHKPLPKTAKFIMKPWAADALLALFLHDLALPPEEGLRLAVQTTRERTEHRVLW